MWANVKKCATSKKKLFATSLVLLGLSVLSGTTLAYISTVTQPISAQFPIEIPADSASTESAGSEIMLTTAESGNRTISIKNSGNIPVYVRAVVIATAGDTNTSAYAPENGDYTIEYADDTAWVLAEDGFWYYTALVASEDSTDSLIQDMQKHVSGEISVEVLVQTCNQDSVIQNWSSGVKGINDNGTLKIEEAER